MRRASNESSEHTEEQEGCSGWDGALFSHGFAVVQDPILILDEEDLLFYFAVSAHPCEPAAADQYQRLRSPMQAVRYILPLFLILPLLLESVRTVEAQTLRGSRTSVDRIHRQALNHGLHFYESASTVKRGVADGRLVRLSGNADYQLAGVSYPYVLPATVTFVERLASQYRSACGERMVVTSAMRPRSFRLVNSVDKSVHPTGMAVDLRKPTKPRCLAWLRNTLLALEATGVLEAVEERNPPHFHVAVFPTPYRQYVQRQGGVAPVAANSGARTAKAAAKNSAPASESKTTYRVRKGDSLWTIAKRHGRSVEEIKRANDMRSSRILAGQVLVIPQAR